MDGGGLGLLFKCLMKKQNHDLPDQRAQAILG